MYLTNKSRTETTITLHLVVHRSVFSSGNTSNWAINFQHCCNFTANQQKSNTQTVFGTLTHTHRFTYTTHQIYTPKYSIGKWIYRYYIGMCVDKIRWWILYFRYIYILREYRYSCANFQIECDPFFAHQCDAMPKNRFICQNLQGIRICVE